MIFFRMAYKDFTEMPVWQLASEIVTDIYKLTGKLPKKEDYALSGQMRFFVRKIKMRPINQKCKKVIEDLNKLIKSLSLNAVLHAHPQPKP